MSEPLGTFDLTPEQERMLMEEPVLYGELTPLVSIIPLVPTKKDLEFQAYMRDMQGIVLHSFAVPKEYLEDPRWKDV